MATHAANEANSGGVAVITKQHIKNASDDLQSTALALYETARWSELKVDVSGRKKPLTIASFYGISRCATTDKKYRVDEELVSDAITTTIEAGDALYLLCWDFNVNPKDSQAVASAINSGLVVDIGHERASNWTEDDSGESTQIVENTYHKDGLAEGRTGKGSTRIDTILANPTAASAIKYFRLRWDLIDEAHVPLQVEMDFDALNEDEVVQKTAGTIKCDVEPEDIDCDIGKV